MSARATFVLEALVTLLRERGHNLDEPPRPLDHRRDLQPPPMVFYDPTERRDKLGRPVDADGRPLCKGYPFSPRSKFCLLCNRETGALVSARPRFHLVAGVDLCPRCVVYLVAGLVGEDGDSSVRGPLPGAPVVIPDVEVAR